MKVRTVLFATVFAIASQAALAEGQADRQNDRRVVDVLNAVPAPYSGDYRTVRGQREYVGDRAIQHRAALKTSVDTKRAFRFEKGQRVYEDASS